MHILNFNGRKVVTMEIDTSDMIMKLRRGKIITCIKCRKGHYVTKEGYTQQSNSFWCDNCGHLLHMDPVESIVK